MNKILLIVLVIAITAAFAFTAIQAPTAGSAAAAVSTCQKVGWNTRCAAYMPDATGQSNAFLVSLPVYKPNVGWNT